ncbi:multiubiquitin domain-containing protein [Stenotrophomonas sp. B2]|uniref:multiubiquitin domain-containing protein n=1 Tax=Stenotrophomonas sp. B2 TaxID=1537778 RepID=UPI0018758868|nr:multiubiquitin domain-containing protein [Stenotrophomonas sp. B2]MBE5270589.1 multiubiquitin domain-containing protein [Stenotrophomonas sp. B2]
MTIEPAVEEDVERAVMAGRAVSHEGPWRIQVGDDALQFRSIVVTDPILTGSQILAVAGVRDRIEHLVYQMLPSGLLEEINPEETTDIRSNRAARFLLFKNDRSFRLLVDDRTLDWGAGRISGATLRALAGRDEPDLFIWQDLRSQADLLVLDEDLVDLTLPGVERFYLREVTFNIFVNGSPETLSRPRLAYWDVVKLGFPDANPAEEIVYTIDYIGGPHQNPEGTMSAGQSVRIKEGMKFYVTPSDKS